jgi:hypothetical protein
VYPPSLNPLSGLRPLVLRGLTAKATGLQSKSEAFRKAFESLGVVRDD